MRLKTWKAALLLGAICLAAAEAHAQIAQQDPQIVELSPASVALFKNGYGFVESQADLPVGAQKVWLKNPPSATLGTLWFGSHGDVRVASVRIFKHKTVKSADAQSVEALIRANDGKHAKVWIVKGGESETILEGDIWTPDPPKKEENAPQPMPIASSFRFNPHPQPEGPPAPPSYFILRSAESSMVLRMGQIARIEIAGAATVGEEPAEEPLIECKLDKPAAAGDKLLVHYLASGLSWMPAYEIELGKEKAGLRWQATLMNDAIDLKAVKVRCIVGYPNFEFSHLQDPLTAGQTVQEFLQQLFSGRGNDGGGGFANGRNIVAQQAMSNNAFYFNGDAQPAMPAAPGGGDWKEDLFYLPSIEADLARGERATFMLAEETGITYRHLHTWEIADTIPLDNNNYYNNNNANAEPPPVWHQIELVNPGKRPWTTGSAVVVQDGSPISQDTLRFTMSGGKSTVKITRAADVTAEAKEFEKERTSSAKQLYGTDYDLVKVRGEMKICSRKGEPVEIRVTKKTTGNVAAADPQGKVEVRAEGLRPVNQMSTIEWTLTLKPNEEKVLSYETQVYVRH